MGGAKKLISFLYPIPLNLEKLSPSGFLISSSIYFPILSPYEIQIPVITMQSSANGIQIFQQSAIS